MHASKRSTPLTTHTIGRWKRGVGGECGKGASGYQSEVKSFNIVALINQHLAISGLIQANGSSAGLL